MPNPFKDLDWKSIALGCRIKSFEQDDKRIRIVEFSQEFQENEWCTNGHCGYVIEGEIEIDFDGRIESFSQGDGIFIPSGNANRHKHHATIHRAKIFLVEDI